MAVEGYCRRRRGGSLAGRQVGRLTVLEEVEPVGKRRRWRCRCRCGTERVVLDQNLRSRRTQSCGCWARERPRGPTRHGHAGRYSPTYRVWRRLKASGEVLDASWDDFARFFQDVGPRPSGRHQLCRRLAGRRVDPGGPWAPGRVRWVRRLDRQRRPPEKMVVGLDGVERPLREWAHLLGRAVTTIRRRLRRGWPVGRALTEPV